MPYLLTRIVRIMRLPVFTSESWQHSVGCSAMPHALLTVPLLCTTAGGTPHAAAAARCAAALAA